MIKTAARLDQVKTYYFAKKLKEIAQLNADGHNIINLGIGSPDLPPPPAASQALIAGLQTEKAHQYQSYYGIAELRNAFANFYQNHFGITANPDTELLPLIGSKEGIMHIAMTFLDPGDEVLIPNPGYPSYRMTTLLAGGTPVQYDLTKASEWEPDFSALEKTDLSKVKLMWVNYPNMPTGKKASVRLFEKLIQFGADNNILICHDNPYAFILSDQPMSIMSIAGAKEHALELSSLSKSYNMSGWRVGAIHGHADYLASIIRFKSNMDSGMFKPVQLAAAQALNSDAEWFLNLNKEYTTRRTAAWKLFDTLGLSYDKESAGLFVWGEVPSGKGEEWSDRILNEAKVFLTPGFIFGSNGEQYLRLSLCSTKEQIDTAHHRIQERI